MVKVGQIWEDTDKRRAGRQFRVYNIVPVFDGTREIWVEYLNTRRRMSIKEDRFGRKGRKQAYKLVGVVEGAVNAATTEKPAA